MTRDIKDFLIEKTIEGIEDTEDGKTIKHFIEELWQDDDFTAQRLVICMAIDCKNSLKIYKTTKPDDNIYLRDLRTCIIKASNCSIKLSSFPTELSNRWKFAWALKQTTFEDKIPCIDCTNEPNYSRVYTFSSYLKWVVGLNKEHNLGVDYVDGDLDELNRNYLKFKAGKKFTSCKVTRLGNERFVFICDEEELSGMGYDNTEEIVDSLGLYTKDTAASEKFVCLNYDSSFDVDTWQPDARTGDWGFIDSDFLKNGNDFFLSYYDNDRFGRTFSTSGSGNQLKERVHLPFDHKGDEVYEMKAVSLGELESSIPKGKNELILEEAINRYNQG